MIPRAFFVTAGAGMDPEQANAFDRALQAAGISECNLVEVSSILPANAQETARDSVRLLPGEITFCVLSRADGATGEMIGAGIGYGWLGSQNERGEVQRAYGIICEHHGHYSRTYLAEKIREKLARMAELRGTRLLKMEVLAESVEVERGCAFGSVVVALVFLF